MLAAGARKAVSRHDKELDEALIWDFFGHRYGWLKDEVEGRLPRRLPQRLLELAAIRAEVEREQAEKAKG